MSTFAQVALCTADLPRTVRTFVEVLGFESAGGRPRWGEDAARIQQLPSGDDTSVMMWWLVGAQDFVQIELFQHLVPAQRPRRAGWKPSDMGWVRFGVAVEDFDRTLSNLHHAGLAPLTEPLVTEQGRRLCFREPGTDVLVEVLEQAPGPLATADASARRGPLIVYATASVRDLTGAREHFGTALGLPEAAADSLHGPEHESLWGLGNSSRECAVFRAGDAFVEAVHYRVPAPREPAPDALLSDQGFMNVALGYRERDAMLRDLAAATSRGAVATTGPPEVAGSVYLRTVEGLSVELLLVPPELDQAYGFRST